MTIRAQDMTSRQFRGLLVKITNTGRQLDALVSQGIAYAAYHHVAHGNKAPWDALIEAAPKFAHKVIRDAKKACANTDREQIDTVLPEVESAAVSQLEERRTKGASHKSGDDSADKAASYALVHKVGSKTEDSIALTSEEFEAAKVAVQALRESKTGDMDRARKVEDMQHRKTGTNG